MAVAQRTARPALSKDACSKLSLRTGGEKLFYVVHTLV